MINIAALQPQPAPGPRPGRNVHQARCSARTRLILYLVTPPEDVTMMSSQVNIFITAMPNTRARINVLAGITCVRASSVLGTRSRVDPRSDVPVAPLSSTCQPSPSDHIVIMMLNGGLR